MGETGFEIGDERRLGLSIRELRFARTDIAPALRAGAMNEIHGAQGSGPILGRRALMAVDAQLSGVGGITF